MPPSVDATGRTRTLRSRTLPERMAAPWRPRCTTCGPSPKPLRTRSTPYGPRPPPEVAAAEQQTSEAEQHRREASAERDAAPTPSSTPQPRRSPAIEAAQAEWGDALAAGEQAPGQAGRAGPPETEQLIEQTRARRRPPRSSRRRRTPNGGPPRLSRTPPRRSGPHSGWPKTPGHGRVVGRGRPRPYERGPSITAVEARAGQRRGAADGRRPGRRQRPAGVGNRAAVEVAALAARVRLTARCAQPPSGRARIVHRRPAGRPAASDGRAPPVPTRRSFCAGPVRAGPSPRPWPARPRASGKRPAAARCCGARVRRGGVMGGQRP